MKELCAELRQDREEARKEKERKIAEETRLREKAERAEEGDGGFMARTSKKIAAESSTKLRTSASLSEADE